MKVNINIVLLHVLLTSRRNCNIALFELKANSFFRLAYSPTAASGIDTSYHTSIKIELETCFRRSIKLFHNTEIEKNKTIAQEPLILLKSNAVSLTAKSTWNGAICSRNINKCFTRNSCPSMPLWNITKRWERSFKRYKLRKRRIHKWLNEKMYRTYLVFCYNITSLHQGLNAHW